MTCCEIAVCVNINATNRLSDFSTGTCIEHTCTRSNGRINFMCTVEKGETADEDLLRAKIHFNYFCSKDVWCQYRTKVSDINIDTHEELIRIPFDLQPKITKSRLSLYSLL